jgi:hypothetical protein
MSRSGQARQTLTAIVEADPDRVWGALLESSPYITPPVSEMIAASEGTVRFPADANGIYVESDNKQHTLAISGQWWFRGEYRVRQERPHTLLTYQVFNVAPAATRWLVPLVAGSALRASARPQFEHVLGEIGDLLSCPVRLVG